MSRPTKTRFSELRRRGRGGKIGVTIVVAGLLTLAMLPGAASAEVPPPFWRVCERGPVGLPPIGTEAGRCLLPRGIGSDPGTGNVYVSDQGHQRIQEFTAWGTFVKAWGWGVADGTPELQSCGPEASPPTATCGEGLQGNGVGQLSEPQGIVVDGSGDVYVVDYGNSRVQKFDSEGNFLLMFGGGVDQGPNHPGNLCTAQYIAEGDSCGAGTAGSPGPGEGQFGTWPVASFIATGPANTVYVGDQERIQIFESDGNFKSQIPLPGKGLVDALAVAPSGNIYVGFKASAGSDEPPSPDIVKLNPSGTTTLCTIEIAEPTAIASDSEEGLYAVDKASPGTVRQFDSACADKHEPFEFGQDGVNLSSGIATSVACGVKGISVYVSGFRFQQQSIFNVLRAFGHSPDPQVCPPPKIPPSIDAQYATSVGLNDAVLRAQINPHFWADTTYYLEYGPNSCAVSTCTQQPLPAGTGLKGAVSGEDITSGSIVLSGLQPATTYHYRFVSQSGGSEHEPVRGVGGEVGVNGGEGTFTTFPAALRSKMSCPNQDFRTATSAHLPDCRAHEMVSPVDKNNGDIAVLGRFTEFNYPTGLQQSSSDGERITYSSATAFGDAVSAPFTSQYIATRSEAGWATHAISPPRESKSVTNFFSTKLDLEYKAFSSDLCTAWLVHDSDPPLASGATAGVLNLYSRENCGAGMNSYEALTTTAPPGLEPFNFYRMELQGFSSDGTKTFFTATDKLTEDAKSGREFQLYEASGGELHYVCVLPNGTSSEGCTAGTNNTPLNDGRENATFRAVSEDGSRVYWSASARGPGKLYLRENPDQEQSAIEGGECSEPEKACSVAVSGGQARFVTASVDGSTAFFTEADKLFEFSAEGAARSLIAEGADIVGASEDASQVYLVSTDVLSGTPNSEGGKAKEGQPNLYLYERGEEESKFTFVAIAADALSGNTFSGTQIPVSRESRVSPDGRTLIFTSRSSPTGYDNVDVESGEADGEVYRYSAPTNTLTCVSCNPSGARPRGQDVKIDGRSEGRWAAAQVSTWESQLYAPRALSDDGRRLFFNSFDALVPRDTNGAQDVYEWEQADSTRACEEVGAELFVESADGCLSLISSGESPTDSEFSDASPDGRDVFFKTASSLLPQDPGLIDIYDARENGGFPAAQAKAGCEGEACQGPLSAPNDPTPASAAFRGAGNVKKAVSGRCAKGKAHRKGRCVATRKHKHAKRANHKRRAGR